MKVRVVQGHTRLVGVIFEEDGEPVLGVSPLLGERAIHELRDAMGRVTVTEKVAITVGMGGLLTYVEVAELVHLSERTIRRYKAEGRIDSTHVGRAVRFAPAHYLRLMQEGPAAPGTFGPLPDVQGGPAIHDGEPPGEPVERDTPIAA